MKRVFGYLAIVVGMTTGSVASAAPILWSSADGGNDHWYEVILGQQTWQQADAAAASSTHMGQVGYLATITSAEEQAFLNGLNPSNNNLWLGGSDEVNEGIWQWVRGPEAGTLINAGYNNWAPGEPNDYGPGEDYLQGWWSGSRWNDLRTSWTHLNNGYVVEYQPAPVPLPASLPLLASGFGLAWFLRRKQKTV